MKWWSKRFARPPLRPQFYSRAHFGNLTSAERTLLRCCRFGSSADIGSAPPLAMTSKNRLRGDFIAFLMQGDDAQVPVHGAGIKIQGAWIDGDITFEGRSSSSRLNLTHCYIMGNLARLLHRVDNFGWRM